MKIVLSGGGTGGHVYPAIAIAEALKKKFRNARFLYIGVRGRAEERIVPRLGYDIRYVSSAGLSGRLLSPQAMLAAARMAAGMAQAVFYLLRFRPDLLIGTGGYASVPAVLGAVLLRRLGLLHTRVFIHEQNYSPGRWNRLISRYADRVWVSFEGTRRHLPGAKIEVTGYPVREKIVPLDRAESRRHLGIPEEHSVVLAFGGSQGARTINRSLARALPALLEDPALEIYHGTGAQRSRDYDAVADTERIISGLGLDQEKSARYHRSDFFTDIERYYAAADLVVSRAGAGTLNEISRCGRPAILIPKSNLAGEHQAVNALAMERAGAAEVIFERPVISNGRPLPEVDPDELAARIRELISDKQKISDMSAACLGLESAASPEAFVRSVESELAGEKPEPIENTGPADDSAEPGPGDLARLSPAGLLSYAKRTFGQLSAEEVSSHVNVGMVRYFADVFLVSPRWQIRNIGVKTAGLTRHAARRGLLASLAGDRTPAAWCQRLMGRDFVQVGFIRRNAVTALARINIWDDTLRSLLLSALREDPYYEVRVEAAATITTMRDRTGSDSELTEALRENLEHRSLEVRWSCLEAMGAVSPDAGFLDRPGRFLLHPNWRIRQALISSVGHLLSRGVITVDDPVLDRLEELMPTCTDFIPTFPLKRSINKFKDIRRGGRIEA